MSGSGSPTADRSMKPSRRRSTFDEAHDADDEPDDDDDNEDENDFGGDDFDDFEEGAQATADDDFGDFDDGFQEPEAVDVSRPPVPISQTNTIPVDPFVSFFCCPSTQDLMQPHSVRMLTSCLFGSAPLAFDRFRFLVINTRPPRHNPNTP